MRSPIKKMSLQSEIVKYIQEYIKDEELKCGDQLPSQRELVEMMGVSRTSLREAIRSMEGQGLLEVRNGKGVFVGDSLRQEGFQVTISFHQEKEKMLEMLEARAILEEDLLRLVVHRITEDEIRELGRLTEILMRKFRAKEPKAQEDKDFHHYIYRCCHNEILYSVMSAVSGWLDEFWSGHPLGMENPFEGGLPYHEKLYEAIRDRDLRRALQAEEAIMKDIREELENADVR